ncbi:regulatory protein RecX [Patescibacteria group bacterium]|nr:MAG: regulatory protein RecX [Patescibacteria group bacterium]
MADSERLQQAVVAASNLLSYRPRSRYELEQALARKGFSNQVVRQALEQLQEHDLINDDRFARLWVQDRIRSAKRSRLQIQVELQRKGIARDIIAAALAEYTDQEEIEVVKRCVDLYGLRQRYPDDQDLIGYLRRKGFGYTAIKQAIAQK